MKAIASLTPMLARLIPRLSSPFDGEKLATLAAIERALKAKGLDLHDFAAALDRPESSARIIPRDHPPAPNGTASTVSEARKRITWLLEEPDQLSPREDEFLRSLRGQLRAGRPPSPKQAAWLLDVYYRCFIDGDRR
jgi:hypothetical protein